MPVYRIGEREFKTKKASYEYCKSVLRAVYNFYMDGSGSESDIITSDNNKGDDYFNYLVDLLNLHPHKKEIIGCGLLGFKVEFDMFNNIILLAVRTDKTKNHFSWVKTCKFTHKPSS
tara:strand:- start:1944 stop:2294 length:351 start_codon:yes stop_codon:yes gene_type:complete